ncbi:hypothetical protein BCV72DRAFT_302408 [Rhizopus microsporus var. microsporus]|uniref:Uncharacterized protein n=2 Tax=Rhizopus microsporus TaxID=58291 RepID=A0A2G4T9K2_RHIZD|nr:uncharacterized protein RHIMIDRAFT_232809 [Rhizopus microsporus ATCC 52813]ORE09903.1 hypothetical protein BCV72DRAFT_302408 [Rhizopus microsporus var. microsporus]PHZ17376.1 hypothetical protein RHIMIDRAFT_232809 [Rhizopus microsporus ATCC 52813]
MSSKKAETSRLCKLSWKRLGGLQLTTLQQEKNWIEMPKNYKQRRFVSQTASNIENDDEDDNKNLFFSFEVIEKIQKTRFEESAIKRSSYSSKTHGGFNGRGRSNEGSFRVLYSALVVIEKRL